MLDAQRATTAVRMVLPHGSRWAADMYAETVTVLRADEDDAEVELALLPPLADRVGMLLLAAGVGRVRHRPARNSPRAASPRPRNC